MVLVAFFLSTSSCTNETSHQLLHGIVKLDRTLFYAPEQARKWLTKIIFAGAETTVSANTERCCFAASLLPSPGPVIKPSATNVANSRAIGTTLSPPPGVMVPVHNAVPSDLSVKVCMSHLLLHRSGCKLAVKKSRYIERLNFNRLFLNFEKVFFPYNLSIST